MFRFSTKILKCSSQEWLCYSFIHALTILYVMVILLLTVNQCIPAHITVVNLVFWPLNELSDWMNNVNHCLTTLCKVWRPQRKEYSLHLEKDPTLKSTREFTLERNHMDVISVDNASLKLKVLKFIRGFTLEKSLMVAIIVNNISL